MVANGWCIFLGNNELLGERIRIRRFEAQDLDRLFAWGQEGYYQETAGFPHLENHNYAIQLLRKYQKRPGSYAIALRETDELIGLLELNERGLDENSGLLQTKDLGFMLDLAYQHQGFMTEALNLFLPSVIKVLGLTEIWAGVYPENQKSKQLLAKYGFEYVYTADYSLILPNQNYTEDYYLLKIKK